jgi:hypothetical protein
MTKTTFPNDDKSALEIIRELTAGAYPQDESHDPLPVSVHTRSLSGNNTRPDPLLPASAESEQQPFTNEIDSLQFALQRLQLSFPRVSSIEEQLQLASAMNLITASLARMVRTQKYITANRPTEYNRQIQAALDVVMKEWTRST